MHIVCPLSFAPRRSVFAPKGVWSLVCISVLTIILILASKEIAPAASISAVDSRDGKTRIDLVGEIIPGDADTLKSVIQKANDANRMVVTIRLNSKGGNLVEGAVIADIVRKGKIATSVLGNSLCASACFIIFAAGNEKYAHYTAQIGVHGASDENGQETVQSSAATVGMARIVKELGVPASIVGKMVVTPPDQMVWLSVDDLRSMDTKMFGKPMQLPTDQPSTSQLQHSINPGTQATAPAVQPPNWSAIVDGAIRISSKQNNGKPNYVRGCQPEFKSCNSAILFKNNDGTDTMIKETEDLKGKIVEREICNFNKPGDVRTCLNWDKGTSHRDMKDPKGDWYKVSDE
jgi:hypothetical protein